VSEIVKVVSENEIIKAKGRGSNITREDGSPVSFAAAAAEKKALTDEQKFLKFLVEQLGIQQKDNAQLIERLVATFRNQKVELEQAPAPEVVVQVEAAKTPEVVVHIDSPKAWEFTVHRDHNGLIQNMTAKRTK
jgi:hypothetical protein